MQARHTSSATAFGIFSVFSLLLTSVPSFAVSLTEISAQGIAKDATLNYDDATGLTHIALASFAAFESVDGLDGTAVLRSLGSTNSTDKGQVTAINGAVLTGGALLDVTFVYRTDSNDPFDMRGYERGAFLSGEQINTVRYDNRLVECTRSINGPNYGMNHENFSSYSDYDLSLYMALPHYYGHNYPAYRHPNRHFGYSDFYRDSAPYLSDRMRERARERERERARERRQDRARLARDVARDVARDEAREEAREYRRDQARDQARERSVERDRSRRGRGEARNSEPKAPRGDNMRQPRGARSNGLSILRSDTPRAENHPVKDIQYPERVRDRNQLDRSPRGYSTVKTPYSNMKTPRQAVKTPRKSERVKNTRPKSAHQKPTGQKPTHTKPVRTKPTHAKPAHAKTPRSTRSRQNRNSKQTRDKALDRSVDRTFRRNNPRFERSERIKHFFPLQTGLSGVVVSSTLQAGENHSGCVREEVLTLHIPEARLDAARFDGLFVTLINRNSQGTQIYIPPNYIAGFQKARADYAGIVYSPKTPSIRSNGTLSLPANGPANVPSRSMPESSTTPQGYPAITQ